MLIGNGLLAGRFRPFENDDRFLIFAAGVSNSKNRQVGDFTREAETLKKALDENPGKIPVYFSTYSVYDPEEKISVYVQHKLNMEKLVQDNSDKHFILRVSNVVGKSTNPNTLLNYFFYHIKNQVNFDLWVNACRNLLDLDDLFFITDRLLRSSRVYTNPINVGAPVYYKVTEIVKAIEFFLGIKSNYIEVSKGSCIEMDLSDISPILKECQSNFDNDYLAGLLVKYY